MCIRYMINQNMESVCEISGILCDANLKGFCHANFKTSILYVAAITVVRTLIRDSRAKVEECVFLVLPKKALDYSQQVF